MDSRPDRKRSPGTPPRGAAGFTLVEIGLVIAVLAIMAGFIVPRMGAVKRSEAQLAADEIEDLLRMFAYRHSIMTQQVGIWRRPDDGTIAIMIRDIDPAREDDARIWQEDKLSVPVTLPPEIDVVEVRSDSEWLDPGSFFVQTAPDGRRPSVEIRLLGPSGEFTLGLDAHASAPRRTSPGGRDGEFREPVDLNAEGLERLPW
jgi:type II secretory pathway pseudopilin PulG